MNILKVHSDPGWAWFTDWMKRIHGKHTRTQDPKIAWLYDAAEAIIAGTEVPEAPKTGNRRWQAADARLETMRRSIGDARERVGLQRDWPPACPECGGDIWICRSASYWAEWVKCDECDWRSDSAPIPQHRRDFYEGVTA